MGWDAWRAEFEQDLRRGAGRGRRGAAVRPRRRRRSRRRPRGRGRRRRGSPTRPPRRGAELRGPGFLPQSRAAARAARRPPSRAGRATNVRPQKQAGYAARDRDASRSATSPARSCACSPTWRPRYGDGTVRTTHEQNLALPLGAGRAALRDLHRRLAAAGLGLAGARHRSPTSTSCPGAEACRLAVTQSRGLGRLLADHLRARPDLVARRPDLDIKISGCPNGCGQHHVAGLGFQGSVRKLGGRAVPQYFVMLGGGVDDGTAPTSRASRPRSRRAACPRRVERLIGLYRRSGGRRDGQGVLPPRGARRASRRSSPTSRRSRPRPPCPRTSWTSARRPSSRSRRSRASAAPEPAFRGAADQRSNVTTSRRSPQLIVRATLPAASTSVMPMRSAVGLTLSNTTPAL